MPDIAIMLLIDGSGSMMGERRQQAMFSSVILHEVLKRHGIKHAIVEHRALYDQPTVLHNILIDFSSKNEENITYFLYNLMKEHERGCLYIGRKNI